MGPETFATGLKTNAPRRSLHHVDVIVQLPYLHSARIDDWANMTEAPRRGRA